MSDTRNIPREDDDSSDGERFSPDSDDDDRELFPPRPSAAAEDVRALIREIVNSVVAKTPRYQINTFDGKMYSPAARTAMFEESFEYDFLLFFVTKSPVLQHTESIRTVVERYFEYVMLSHRWQHDEPSHRVLESNIYEMSAPHGITKLQKFCRTARNLGYRWAWSDTCCIDKTDSKELLEAIASMFSWYRDSALTIVYLFDVRLMADPSDSDWFTRGWTLLELIAPRVIRFYISDWSPYLDDKQLNHKSNEPFLQLLGDITGVDTESLRDFTPGVHRAPEVLRWASNRKTTRVEDMTYSIMGMLAIQVPVIYGDGERAFKRILDILALNGSSGIKQAQLETLRPHVPQNAEGQGSSGPQMTQEAPRLEDDVSELSLRQDFSDTGPLQALPGSGKMQRPLGFASESRSRFGGGVRELSLLSSRSAAMKNTRPLPPTPRDLTGKLQRETESLPRDLTGKLQRGVESLPRDLTGKLQRGVESLPRDLTGKLHRDAESLSRDLTGKLQRDAESLSHDLTGKPQRGAESLSRDPTGMFLGAESLPGDPNVQQFTWIDDLCRVKVAVRGFTRFGLHPRDLIAARESLHRELQVWINLDHVNILHIYGVTFGFGPLLSIVYPWTENGTLAHFVGHTGLPILNPFKLLVGVSHGLQYLHSRSIIHGSISDSNILIDANEKPYLVDAGLYKVTEQLPGARWAAPEWLVLRQEEITRACDIYSFGCITLLVLSGQIPYSAYWDSIIRVLLMSSIKPLRPAEVDDSDWDFMNRCWSFPEERPSIDEVVAFVEEQSAEVESNLQTSILRNLVAS